MIKKGLDVFVSCTHDEVTKSNFLITIKHPNGKVYHLWVDCGLAQERAHLIENYYKEVDPAIIDACFITHNHIDHVGAIATAFNQGLRCPIYISEQAKEAALFDTLMDTCNLQADSAESLRKQYPAEAKKIKPLHSEHDVIGAFRNMVGVEYWDLIQSENFEYPKFVKDKGVQDYKALISEVNPYIYFLEKKKAGELTKNESRFGFEVIPNSGIYCKFYGNNGHTLGSAIIVLTFANGEEIETHIFTGDYKRTSPWRKIPPLPAELLNSQNQVLYIESTYGTTDRSDVKKCLARNIIEAILNGQDILLGVFARERRQEILLFLSNLEKAGIIPYNYIIIVDGALGSSCDFAYKRIIHKYGYKHEKFMPKRAVFADAKNRADLLYRQDYHKIVVTTSGMLSQGPARFYIPYFLSKKNALIHLCGYAAEGTLARLILNTMDAPCKGVTSVEDWNAFVEEQSNEIFYTNGSTGEVLTPTELASKYGIVYFSGQLYDVLCDVKATGECSSHATADELIRLIKHFRNLRFVVINHGERSVKEAFMERVLEECDNVSSVGIINRQTCFRFFFGIPGVKSSFMIRGFNSKTINDPKVIFGNKVKVPKKVKGQAKNHDQKKDKTYNIKGKKKPLSNQSKKVKRTNKRKR